MSDKNNNIKPAEVPDILLSELSRGIRMQSGNNRQLDGDTLDENEAVS